MDKIKKKIDAVFETCNDKQVWTAWRWCIRYILHNTPVGVKDDNFTGLRSYLLCKMKIKTGYWLNLIFDTEAMIYWRKWGKYY